MKSVATIAFDYQPSWSTGIAAALICAGAVGAAWIVDFPVSLRVVLTLMALGFGVRALRRHWWPPFHRIARRRSGWVLVDAANQEHPAILIAHSRIGRLLTLDFRHGAGTRFRPVLAPDNLDSDTHRRLVLLLARGDVVHVG